MTSGRRKAKVVTGLHIVPKQLASGPAWYVYAWRGGPCVHKATGNYPVITREILDKALSAKWERTPAKDNFNSIIDAYRASPEFESREPSTQRDYRLWLDRASARFGTAPIAAFRDFRMRGDIIAWRDEWAKQPRTADKASVTMSMLLEWARERGLIDVNVAAGIKHLHSVDKSDQIWERRHMRAFVNVPRHLKNALILAGLTGLRLGDLVRVKWENVGPHSIIVMTRKRKVRAIIPMIPALRQFLDKLDGDKGEILRNSRGQPWTESGLGSVFQKAKPTGFDRTIHDLRGTYATWLAAKGLTDQEIARALAWSAQRVAEIRARYVDEARVVISLVERLSA